MLAVAAVAIAFFGARVVKAFDHGANSPMASIARVNELLRRASSGQPLDGRPLPDQRWVARMAAACERREKRLAALPRGSTASGIARRGARILAIHRAYAARVSSLRPPAAWAAEAREIRTFNAAQQRILQRVVDAARSGDLGRATREAVGLRELAGRANTVFLTLGLARCAFGGSGMPL